jgi:NhaA family Na+:H+ antiporter
METNYRNSNFARIYGFFDTLGSKLNPGVLLLVIALITMFIANSPLRSWYESLWTVEFMLGSEHFNLLSHDGHPLTMLQLVNDTLMAIFFFSVGLEIKREVMVGELSSFRQALLPLFAACGGMILPILLFFVVGKAQGFSEMQMNGMAIPMATDIAFSLGVLSLLGKKVPLSLKIFLMALAIVDDIGGIIVIALFYSNFSDSTLMYFLLSLVCFGMLILGSKLRVNHKSFYIIFGIGVWYLFLQAGIHPTIAGVLVAFTVPARPHINVRKYMEGMRHDLNLIEGTLSRTDDESIVLTNTQIKYLTRIESASDRVISPLQDFEDNLHGLVNYLIMPLFAFANAGVVFDFSNMVLFSGISLATMVGLFFGKISGIFLFTWIAIKSRISRMPSGMNWKNLFGLAMLAGIGFTVALFLAGLSYPLGSEYLNEAKIGVIIGSVFAGFAGYFYLSTVLSEKKE